jgi:flavin reductase (DIM6/NTAB) family NADH-FMN oxidoreductase RutF
MATPGGSGPIGPYPDGVETDDDKVEYDKLRRRVLWTLPYGLYVVGSRSGLKRNLMTLNWATQVAFEPKLIGIGVEKAAFTHELIAAGEVFSLCTVARQDRAIVRKFTKPVEVDLEAMTLNGFGFHDGQSGAPILDQAPGFLDCRVRQTVDVANHSFFIGEVVDAGFQGDDPDLAQATELLRMEDTRMNYGG